MWKWWAVLSLLILPCSAFGQTERLVKQWQLEWNQTNFEKASVDLKEIISGGPPRDGIPPIYKPVFESVASAKQWLPDSEPVIVHRQGRESRAYPYRILIWHEIVNDQIEGKSFIVTFCPLCNSAIIFDTHFQGKNHRFGVTGKLRHSDMVMWDHTTESWWQQMTGEAIVGEATGTRLTMLPSPSISFGDYKQMFPQGKVLSQRTSYSRSYGNNPYAGYERSGVPFLLKGAADSRLPALARVIGIEWKGKFYTLPLSELQGKKWGSVQAEEGQELLVFNLSAANAALDDGVIANAHLVDHVTIWENRPGEEHLTFYWDGKTLRDKQQKRQWNALGQGLSGNQVQAQLKPVKYGIHFAFAWLAFHPDSIFLRL